MPFDKIEHIVVLMLENRSFDHMLGYLNHPNDSFPGLTGEEYNSVPTTNEKIYVTDDACGGYAVDPAHEHRSVLRQLTSNPNARSPYSITNAGFVADYKLTGENNGALNIGHEIMRCHSPDEVSVLATLAKEFAVCTRWFCSVPGQTWPNRNFAHAGTSDGEVNIRKRFYYNRTIYEDLSEAKRDWRIYRGGYPPQSLVFRNLWREGGKNRFMKLNSYLQDVRSDTLPHYAFIEPSYFLSSLGFSNSQHPGNNRHRNSDFLAGEKLIRDIYMALIQNEKVWRKSLMIITYDEHGGIFDREAPPQGDQYIVDEIHRDDGYEFRFDLLGPRVPTVLVSPYIARGTIVDETFDHASIPRTVREIFIGDENFLSAREKNANGFADQLSLDEPRSDFPVFEEMVDSIPDAHELREEPAELDEFQESLLWLAEEIHRIVNSEAEPNNRGLMPERDVLESPEERLAMLRETYASDLDNIDDWLTILRTPDGRVIENPDDDTLQSELRTHNDMTDPEAKIWLDDLHDHIVIRRADGQVIFIDEDEEHQLPDQTLDGALEYFKMVRDGEIGELQPVPQ